MTKYIQIPFPRGTIIKYFIASFCCRVSYLLNAFLLYSVPRNMFDQYSKIDVWFQPGTFQLQYKFVTR